MFWEVGLWRAGGANKTSAEADSYRERMGFFTSTAVCFSAARDPVGVGAAARGAGDFEAAAAAVRQTVDRLP